jgi:AraC-like DNA-binding protein
MHFRHLEPHPLLKPYIEKLWVFESYGRLTDADLKLIIPNDRIKVAVPYTNEILVKLEDDCHLTKENTFTLTGMMDKPFRMDIANDGFSGTICAEFSPRGVYRFFRLHLTEVKNRVISLADILPHFASTWETQIADATSIDFKLRLFEQFLLQQFQNSSEDSVFEYAVQQISISDGRITIKELERRTGYSSRWLSRKFAEKLGVSPKNLASIIRFQRYYEELSKKDLTTVLSYRSYYDQYYDQSHFIKDVKRYTGLTPGDLDKKNNNWGNLFYNA